MVVHPEASGRETTAKFFFSGMVEPGATSTRMVPLDQGCRRMVSPPVVTVIIFSDESGSSASANRLANDRRTRMQAIVIKTRGGNERNLNFGNEPGEEHDDVVIKGAKM